MSSAKELLDHAKLQPYGLCVMMLHDAHHVKRMRGAMFWSVISLFFVIGELSISAADASQINFSLLGLSLQNITEKKVLMLLGIMTTCYTAAFGYSLLRVYFLTKAYSTRLKTDDADDDREALGTITMSKLLDLPTKSAIFFNLGHRFWGGIGTFGGLVLAPLIICFWALYEIWMALHALPV